MPPIPDTYITEEIVSEEATVVGSVGDANEEKALNGRTSRPKQPCYRAKSTQKALADSANDIEIDHLRLVVSRTNRRPDRQ